jgi:hypothetical protein
VSLAGPKKRRVQAGKPAVKPPPMKPESFEAFAMAFLKRHVERKKLRSQDEIERCIKRLTKSRSLRSGGRWPMRCAN